jgi:hypothetical protein
MFLARRDDAWPVAASRPHPTGLPRLGDWLTAARHQLPALPRWTPSLDPKRAATGAGAQWQRQWPSARDPVPWWPLSSLLSW